MATPWPLLLHLLLLAASRQSSLASAAAVADVLLQFKAALSASASGTDVALRNWVPGSSPCRANVTLWSGVICNLDGSVRGVKIENMSLAGTLNTDALVGIPTLRTMSFKNNSFEGTIPDLTKFPGLRSVYLSMNRFSGELPDGLFDRLQWIKKVHFSRNQFSGPIPSSLARAARLLELRLDGNQFHGRIPNFRQPGLWLANLSNNNLQGPIPRRFRKINADWFAGNDDLCGAPLRYECGSPRRSPGFIAGIILVCIAVLLAAIGLSFIFCRSRKQHKDAGGALPTTQPAKIEPVPANREEHASVGSGKKVPKEEQGRLAFVKDDRVKFNIQDLLKASAEVLGSGSFGSSYKAILSEGPAVVVKRFKEMNGAGREDFYEHMRRLGRLTHPNLLPLVAYYYRKEEKLLVTDYVFHGSLAHLLHGSKGSTSVPPLDWPSRLKIVKGVGRGLRYLHEELPVLAVPHGHLKSSNVLLTYSFEPILSDYALVPVMNKSHASQIMVAFKAPECAGGGRPSKKSDVWSFGILILEILTGRFPANYLRKGRHVGTDLNNWVSSLVKAEEEQQQQQRSAGEVFDANMKGTEGGEGEMLKLLRVALACSEADVERRCELEEALARIEALKERDDHDGNCV
ncbi:pollen receptor-like kinase 5 [Zingiber officinale]|uniref:pollen receptor-like kinase 5 n=1 Tax=Zingiber officinale TaxID=94328 RepID=UPI001C4B1220|nr:pollen receptor-like kinase 5 [Zingiber officinale]